MSNIQSPTLIIGLGGTGVSVLRKFKQRYIDLHGTDERLVKLLAFDTADQPGTMQEPLLTPQEFLHLGKPPINVANVVQQAPTQPALKWLTTSKIPGFSISIGAGMKRFYGHIAYFYRGTDIRTRLENAIDALMKAQLQFAGEGTGTGFRVFVVSSLCGGTGTGMFLDIAYMAHDLIKGADIYAVMFLPSAFQELKNQHFWTNINANGYAALQELQYYMTLDESSGASHGAALPKLPMPSNVNTSMDLESQPFQYCYLVGGVDEGGHPVAHSKDLYDRTAEFLFMTATSSIGATLAAAAANGRKCFASFGSCNLTLPQARCLSKYFLLIGREIMADIFAPVPGDFAPPRFAEKLAAVKGYDDLNGLSIDAAQYAKENIFIQYDMTASDPKQATSIIEKAITDFKASDSFVHEGLASKAVRFESQIREVLEAELRSSWTLEAGTIQRCTQSIDAALHALSQKRATLQSQFRMVEYDAELAAFKAPSKWSKWFSNGPDSRLAQFMDASVSAFQMRANAIAVSEICRVLSVICNDLQERQEKLSCLLGKQPTLLDLLDREVRRHLEAIAHDQGNFSLLSVIDSSKDDDYARDRVGLLSRCRSRDDLRAAIGVPDRAAVSVPVLVKALFHVVDDFVKQKPFRADFADSDFYDRLARASVNLQLQSTFEPPQRQSYLFVSGTEELAGAIASAIGNANLGFEVPKPAGGVNPGSATFVRLITGFELKNLIDIKVMADAYKIRSQTPDAVYLNLPTHKRSPILENSNQDVGPELFAFAQILLGLIDVGQNYLLHGRKLLVTDEADPARRRKLGYDMLATADLRNEIENARDEAARTMGGNASFVPFMKEQLNIRYGTAQGTGEYDELLKREKAAVLAYLNTLAVPNFMPNQTAGHPNPHSMSSQGIAEV